MTSLVVRRVKIALELIYDIDGVDRPTIRYDDGRVTTPAASEVTNFSIVGYAQALRDISTFIDAVYQAAIPDISPKAVVAPLPYSIEHSSDGEMEKFEIKVDDLKYEAISDGGEFIIIEEYTVFDVSWDTFLWIYNQMTQFLSHITSR